MSELPDRYWAKVDKSGPCWLWTASRTKNGYGRFSMAGHVHGAHRLAYSDRFGSIPSGMEVDHLCHVRHCVNPDHLRVATRKQNGENIVAIRSSTGVRDVYRKKTGRFYVLVRHNYDRYYGGTFTNLGEADFAARALRDHLFTHHLDGLPA